MEAKVVISWIFLIVFLVVPFLLIGPGLLELFFGVDFRKDSGDSERDRRQQQTR
jgi:hypothetical protein